MNNINKQLVRSFADAGNRNDLDAFDSIFTKDFQRHCEATPEVTVGCCEDFKQFYIETAKTFPDQIRTRKIALHIGRCSGSRVSLFFPAPPRYPWRCQWTPPRCVSVLAKNQHANQSQSRAE